jgi:hypothetical protein
MPLRIQLLSEKRFTIFKNDEIYAWYPDIDENKME